MPGEPELPDYHLPFFGQKINLPHSPTDLLHQFSIEGHLAHRVLELKERGTVGLVGFIFFGEKLIASEFLSVYGHSTSELYSESRNSVCIIKDNRVRFTSIPRFH